MDTPPEFDLGPDTYQDGPPMWVHTDHFLDGQPVHGAAHSPTFTGPEQEPGWTVQGDRYGQAP